MREKEESEANLTSRRARGRVILSEKLMVYPFVAGYVEGSAYGH